MNSTPRIPLVLKDGFSANSCIESRIRREGGRNLEPLVSIMIPTYNRPALLKQAVESAISQRTGIAFEVVVVDNSTDQLVRVEVERVVNSFTADNLRLFVNDSNIGMFGNWNRCIELARGVYVTILNDDDQLSSDYLSFIEKEISGDITPAIFVKYRSFGLSTVRSSRIIFFIKESLSRTRHALFGSKAISLGTMLHRYPAAGSLGIIFKKKNAIALGGFNEEDWPIADYVFMCKYWNMHGLKMITRTIANYRWHDNESTKPETIVGFIEKGLILRRAMVIWHKKEGFPFIDGAFRLHSLLSLHEYKDRICPSLSLSEVSSRLKLPEHLPMFQFFYRLILSVYWWLFDRLSKPCRTM